MKKINMSRDKRLKIEREKQIERVREVEKRQKRRGVGVCERERDRKGPLFHL